MRVISDKKVMRRLDALVEEGLGEWLIRNVTSWNVRDLLDYEMNVRHLQRTRRARLGYQRKRLGCVARYRKEGKHRTDGVLIEACSQSVGFGGSGEASIHEGDEVVRVRPQHPTGHAMAYQNVLTVGKSYRVRGQHRSELTGGWVEIMDCDHDGKGGFRSPVGPSKYAEFDDLFVAEVPQ